MIKEERIKLEFQFLFFINTISVNYCDMIVLIHQMKLLRFELYQREFGKNDVTIES